MMIRGSARRAEHRRGSVAVVVTLCLVPLIGIMAFAIDGGLMLAAKRRSQTVADASAHAAAVRLYANSTTTDPTGIDIAGNAKEAALTTASANGYSNDGTTNTVQVYFSPNITNSTFNKPFHAQVIVTTIQPRIFAAVLGSGSLTVGAQAVARGISGTAKVYSSASLLVLSASNGASALQVSGGASLITESNIQDNSSNATALSVNNGGLIKASSVEVTGSYSVTGGSSIIGTVQTAAPSIPDPLASLKAPDSTTMTAQSFQSSYLSQTISPGIYSSGLTIGNGGTVTMKPGIYYLQGTGLNIGNGAALIGNGVTIYMDTGAQLTLQGGTSVTLTPPASGTYAGLTYFQNRTSTKSLSISNGAYFNASGTIYAAAASAAINGGTSNKYGSQLIVDTLNISNGASLTLPTKTDALKGYIASGTSTASITLVN